jgi:hypothetical protein
MTDDKRKGTGNPEHEKGKDERIEKAWREERNSDQGTFTREDRQRTRDELPPTLPAEDTTKDETK